MRGNSRRHQTKGGGAEILNFRSPEAQFREQLKIIGAQDNLDVFFLTTIGNLEQ